MSGSTQQPGRKPHRKVKTGCRTCKLRRVKCDESFPACNRCTSIGRVCDGYGVWGGGGALRQSTPNKRLQLQLQSQATSSYEPGFTTTLTRRDCSTYPGPHISVEEQAYLEWFIHGTAAHSPRFFSSPFWWPLILQATTDSPMVLHALLALSAAHKRRVLDPMNRAREGLLPDIQEVFLMKQYGSAMQEMRKHLKVGGKPEKSQLMLAVVTIGLFVLLERTRGNFDALYVHLASGARLTEQVVGNPDKISSGKAGDNRVTHFYKRNLDPVTAFLERRGTMLQTPAHLVTTPPLCFDSPTEAGNYLDVLVNEIANISRDVKLIASSGEPSRQLLKDEKGFAIACLDSWFLAFKATTSSEHSAMTIVDVHAWETLQRRYGLARSACEDILR